MHWEKEHYDGARRRVFVLPFPANFFTQTTKNTQITAFIDCLTNWYEFIIYTNMTIKDNNEHNFEIDVCQVTLTCSFRTCFNFKRLLLDCWAVSVSKTHIHVSAPWQSKITMNTILRLTCAEWLWHVLFGLDLLSSACCLIFELFLYQKHISVFHHRYTQIITFIDCLKSW